MSNRIDLDAIESEWDNYQSDGPIDDYLASLDISRMIAELKRCYEELDRPKVTIDDWDKAGPCVTVYLEGKQYVGILREYDASE